MSEQAISRHTTAVDEGASMIFLPIDRIRPNRTQPRNRFDTNTMIRLADSVRRYGILQPLTVRPITENMDDMPMQVPCYELIAGERRLRAAKLAGLTQVPCILARADDHLSAELAMIENLLREDLDMFEQARAFGRLIVRFSLTQEQVARKMSMSQSAVANKLRLLRLSEEEQREILLGGLTERHARALLRLSPGETRRTAIRAIIERHLNVAATEAYIDDLLAGAGEVLPAKIKDKTELDATTEDKTEGSKREEPENPVKKKLILKDLRIFYNSIEHAVSILKHTGLSPQIEQREENGRVMICISVDNPATERNVSRETLANKQEATLCVSRET